MVSGAGQVSRGSPAGCSRPPQVSPRRFCTAVQHHDLVGDRAANPLQHMLDQPGRQCHARGSSKPPPRLAATSEGLRPDMTSSISSRRGYSPIVFTPQGGKAVTTLYLQAAAWRCPVGARRRRVPEAAPGGTRRSGRRRRLPVHEEGARRRHRRARVRDHHGRGYVNGVDIIRCDDAGRIVEFRVMIRPSRRSRPCTARWRPPSSGLRRRGLSGRSRRDRARADGRPGGAVLHSETCRSTPAVATPGCRHPVVVVVVVRMLSHRAAPGAVPGACGRTGLHLAGPSGPGRQAPPAGAETAAPGSPARRRAGSSTLRPSRAALVVGIGVDRARSRRRRPAVDPPPPPRTRP